MEIEGCSNCLATNVKLIDVIQSWKIVRMCESCAREEGVALTPPILETPSYSYNSNLGSPLRNQQTTQIIKQNIKQDYITLHERAQGKINTQRSNVLPELVDNFSWLISKERRAKRITRKQLGAQINESETVIKMLENRQLPSDDFVIINKVQSALGINLRKDGKTFDTKPIINYQTTPKEKKIVKDDLSGNEIEIIE